MKLIVTLVLVLCFPLHLCKRRISENNSVNDPDLFRNVSQLISSKGYPVDEHSVQTSDGYILSMQRIRYGKKSPLQADKKRVVFLQHGIMTSAADWVLNFPEQSLGFILADEGYDVWLGNSRGNEYCRRHVKYTEDDPQFWEFSFDEQAKYDLPAEIDYILNATREEKLYYIGHSQGTTLAFVLLSERPEYNEKIELFVALAPITAIPHAEGLAKSLFPYDKQIANMFNMFGLNAILPNTYISKIFLRSCRDSDKTNCEDLLFNMIGTDKYQLNETRLDVYVQHFVSGSSVKNLVHHAQMANSKSFAKYDYGEKGNMELYNQTFPPEYDLARITTPMALIWGKNDNLARPTDVGVLQSKLKSIICSYCVDFLYFNHMDFLTGLDARKLVYDKVLSLMAQY